MGASTIEVSATGAWGSTLVISPDAALTDQLRRILEQDHCRRVRVASSFSEAETLLRDGLPATVFADFRKPEGDDCPSAFFSKLGRDARPEVPVIAVSDRGYVCDRAGVADLIVRGHLQLPLDRAQLWRLLEHELAKNGPSGNATASRPRVVHGETVACKTYTPAMSALLDDVLTLAGHAVTVLLVGETGTGKTTLARLIHELSPRRDARLLTVACGALPPDLIESELFGHVKGAFTGAERSKPGKFEAAENGTLLLDEIDVLGPAQQAKLLRVIETGEFEPVGSNDTRHSAARLVVASNLDLKQLVEQNRFRADLYYRLNMLELRIPPLRERPADVVPLTLDFVGEFCSAHDVRIDRVDPDFLACLKQYHWPGNVRELKNHVRRAVLFCRTGTLTPDDLAPHFRQALESGPLLPAGAPKAASQSARETSLVERVAANERRMIEQALRENGQNRTATAKALGLSRVGLYKKMKKLGMAAPRRGE